MEERLSEKDDDYGEMGWLDSKCFIKFLHDRLTERVMLSKSALNDCRIGDLEKLCVDIANFSMMISDRLRER